MGRREAAAEPRVRGARLPARVSRQLTGTDFVDDIRGLDTRFLVIVGDKDPGLDATAMQATFLAWHPNARLMTIPNCGHYPMQECPPYFATIVEAFLRDAAA